MNRPLRVLISAGEASGDRLGAGLARALRSRRPDIELFGMGGPAMESAGVRILQSASEVAVVGILEVIAHLPAVRRAMARLREALESLRPDVIVPVDFPDFNLRLAAAAHASRVPVVYYVSPQLWAWRAGRMATIRRIVDRMLVLFPFEERLYHEAGVPVTFVGHPVAEAPVEDPMSRDDLARIGLDPDGTTVALLPGSRVSEVKRVFPSMLGAAELLAARRPDLRFVVPRAGTLPREFLESFVPAPRHRIVRIHSGDYPAILRSCAAGAVASGTATLDAAVAGLPMVVVYRMSGVSYLLARALVRVEHVALANLVAGRRLVPELIQSECTSEGIATAIERFLVDREAAAQVRAGLAEVRERLEGTGAFERAAAAVLDEAEAALMVRAV